MLFLISSLLLLPALQAFSAKKHPCVEVSEGTLPNLGEVKFDDPLSRNNQVLALNELRILIGEDSEKSEAAFLNLKRYVSLARRAGGVPLEVKKVIRYEAAVKGGIASSNKVAYSRLLLASMSPEKPASQKMLVDLLFFPTRDIAWGAFTMLALAEKESPQILQYLRERCAYLDPSEDGKNTMVIGAGVAYGRLLLAFHEPRSEAAVVNVASALSVTDARINYLALNSNIIPRDSFYSSPMIAAQIGIRNRTMRVSALDVQAYVAEVMKHDVMEPRWFRDPWLLKRFN